MQSILASRAVSVSDFKRAAPSILREAAGQPVAVLNHNKAEFYAVPAQAFEALVLGRRLEQQIAIPA